MADAPGGGGWSAAEVIVALILGIGLITTLTGGTIKPLFDTPDTAKKSSITVKPYSSSPNCTVAVTSPRAKDKVGNSILVSGGFSECISGSSVPDTMYAQVVDSKGTLLSSYTAMPVSKGFFGMGSSTFSATIPLSGTAHSTTGFLILTSPTKTDGTALTKRIAIEFIPGETISAPAGATGDSYFVPNPSAQQPTTYTQTTTTTSSQQTYTPPSTAPPTGSTGGGTTF